MGGAQARRLCPHAVVVLAADGGVLRGEQGGVRGVPRHHAAGRGAVDRRGVPRRARPGADRPARRWRSPCGCGATCSSGSACRSPSAWPGPSSSPRWPAASPSPTGCSWCRPTASSRSCTRSRSSGCGASARSPARKLRDARHHDRRPGGRAGGDDARRDARAGVRPAAARARPQPRSAARCGSAAGGARWGRSARSGGGARGRRRRSTPSLIALVDRVTRRLRAARRVCRTVVLRLRFDDFSRATRSHTLSEATAHTQTILATARGLLAAAMPMIERQGLTLVGVALGNLEDDDAVQLALPFDRQRAARRHARRRCATGSARPRSPARCCSAATRASRCRCCPTDRAGPPFPIRSAAWPPLLAPGCWSYSRCWSGSPWPRRRPRPRPSRCAAASTTPTCSAPRRARSWTLLDARGRGRRRRQGRPLRQQDLPRGRPGRGYPVRARQAASRRSLQGPARRREPAARPSTAARS